MTFDKTETLLSKLISEINQSTVPSNIVIMSNGGFENLHQRLINKLQTG